MRWSPPLVAVLAACACGFDEDASTSATGGGSHGSGTTGPTTGEPTTGQGLPPDFWTGVVCAPPEEEQEGGPRVFFDLDAGKAEGKDFFRLPFPLDARRAGGGVAMDGFPSPPPELDPAFGTVVDRWLSHIAGDTGGFSVNGAVLFRSSHGISALGGVHYVNLSPGHPDYGQTLAGISYRAQNGTVSGNNYICRNWLAIETVDGYPLEPGVTYGVLLTADLKPLGADRFKPDADFSLMLQGTAPSDSRRRGAWQTFAPLREFLASPENATGLSASDLVGGTVFTTASNRDVLAGARTAARAAPLHVSDLHVCEAAGDSPCSTAPGLTEEERAERRCGPPSSGYREIHGRIRLPLYQEGKSPYESIGGRIDVEGGLPVQRSSVDACFSLTLPTSAAPDAGFPALVYAHGTGGGFRSPLNEGVAQELAKIGVATIALEGVVHGERRGDTDDDGKVAGLTVDQLVFNVFNPESARDTIVQAAIDQFTAVRMAEEWQDATLLEGQTIRFDPAALFFMGHSQGANAGSLFLPYEPLVRAAVLSGGGSNLLRALLAKEEPQVEIPGTGQFLAPRELLQIAFQERPDRPLDTAHPMLVLLNTFVNRSDADNTAELLRRAPIEGVSAKHLLNYIGHVDNYTPLRAAGNLAILAGAPLAGGTLFPPPCDQYAGAEKTACGWTEGGWLPTTSLPASGNMSGVTAVSRMLPAPAGKDGHYVAFQPAELQRIAQFIASAVQDGTPTVQ
jgi:dienelactone hydrolase